MLLNLHKGAPPVLQEIRIKVIKSLTYLSKDSSYVKKCTTNVCENRLYEIIEVSDDLKEL